MSNNVFNGQTNLLIRDGFAAEVFFGDLDGETIAIEEIENLAAPIRYLLDQRSTLGYKSILYLDALARQMNYYMVFEGAKLSKGPEEYIKAPLYIPNDVIELIKTAFEKAYFRYIKRDEEKFEGFADILSVWRFHNDQLIPKYVAHIQAEGILEQKPSRQMFSKISENKRALVETFGIFGNMLANKKDSVTFFAKRMTATPLFAYFNKKLIKRSIFEINAQESESVSGFLSYMDRSGKNRIVLENADSSFLFSMLAPERPIFEKGEVKAQNAYTLADVLLYSETSKNNKKHEKALKSIYGAGQLYSNKEFETKIREILQLSSKYEEAYAKIGKIGNRDLLEKSYLKETHDAIMDHFVFALKQEAKKEFSVFLENESKKKVQTSSFTIAKESFAFSAVLYVIRNIFDRNIHLLPIVDEDSSLRELQDKEIRRAFRQIVDTLVPQYLSAREAYIAQNHNASATEKHGSKEASKNNNAPEQTKAEQEQIPEPSDPENDTMPKMKSESDSGFSAKAQNREDDDEDEDVQKITVGDLENILDEFGE